MAWVEKRGTGFRVRLRMPDGIVVTDSVHENRFSAATRAKEIDVEVVKETFLDPRDGKLTLREWVAIWEQTHQVGPATWSAYRSHLCLHILPRLGHMPINAIRRQHVKMLAKDLSTKMTSVADVVKVLSLVLRKAVEDRRIPFNPAHGMKPATRRRPERPAAIPEQVAQIAARMRRREDQILVITAAYTGMRWGELTGLARANLDLERADVYIHPQVGALHEVDGKLFLGPPKTHDSARHVRLPDFLVGLLHEQLGSHPYPIVFPGARGALQRRSNFARRAWSAAVDGDPDNGVPTIAEGMHFHDLRHSHKTWMIEDHVPEVAQSARIGHRLPGVRGIYSHVTPAMEQTIVEALQRRWEHSTGIAAVRSQTVSNRDDTDWAA